MLNDRAICVSVFLFAMPCAAQPPATDAGPPVDRERSSVLISVEGAFVTQAAADLDSGGDFDVSRWGVTPRVTWNIDPKLSLSLSAGYTRTEYDFDGPGGFGDLDPWDDVDTVRFGASVRWSVDDEWTVFLGPSVRFAAESGADLDDGVSGGLIAGASYRVSDRLSIGPGVGVFSQIEDDVSVYPLLVIDWKISETLTFRTGRGRGSSQGPGLALVWSFAPDWDLAVGARYERRRFRLDDEGVAPDGVGEESSFPIVAELTWRFMEHASVNLVAGVAFAGELRIEDDDGHKIAEDDYDPAAFVGLSIGVRF